MQIRKNTKPFKTILQIVTECNERPNRDKLIRLFITKAGQTIHDRVNIEGIQGQAALFYDMAYQNLMGYLHSSQHQLHQSDDLPGVYFFQSASNKTWPELPFEFDEAISIEFYNLPDLPVVRKKEKTGSIAFPTASVKATPKKTKETKKLAKAKSVPEPSGPKQPDYNLKHEIEFTTLDKIIFRRQQLTKKDILDYYNKVSDVLLPHIKDRPLSIKGNVDLGRGVEYNSIEDLAKNHVDVPEWFHSPKLKTDNDLIANDKDRLLYLVEIGAAEVDVGNARLKSPASPDYLVIVVESPETSLGEVIPAAHAIHDVLEGLKLPSVVKTDGAAALHIYVPLDGKSEFETAFSCAEYICRLARIKKPDLIALREHTESGYQKVTVDFQVNAWSTRIVAPYSLVKGSAATVATPLSWDEVNDNLRPEEFNYESIFKRIKSSGDLFELISKKKVDANALLERLELNYSFLFSE